jgi:uncharacterized protein (TIRG00374 family)
MNKTLRPCRAVFGTREISLSKAAERRLAIGALLGLALLALFFRGVDLRALAEAFRLADPVLLAGVVLATVVTYLARSWRWGYLLAPVVRVSFCRLLSATCVGFMSGLVIPRAGELVRPWLIARRHEVTTSAAFASIILERLIDLITVVILFGLYLYVLPRPAAESAGRLLGTLRAGGVLAGLVALAVLGLLLALHLRAEATLAVLDRALDRLPSRVAAPVSHAVRSFTAGLAVLQAPPRHLLAIAGQSLLVWLSIALGLFWNNLAFGLRLPFHATFLLLGFLTVGVAVPTPGMVGGFHEAYLLALTQAFGASSHTAAAAGITAHALTNVPVLLLGLFFLGREGLSLGKVAQVGGQHAQGAGARHERAAEAR